MSDSEDVAAPADPTDAADAADAAVGGDDLSGAPVPDLDRISRCTCSVRAAGAQVELWGPPAGILSIARWLRAPTEDLATLAGEPRADWEPGPGQVCIVATDGGAGDGDGLVGLSVADGRFTITGSGDGLARLGEVVESIGVYALDLRWSPVERRQLVVVEGSTPAASGADGAPGPGEPGVALLRPGSPSLLVASAYPRDP